MAITDGSIQPTLPLTTTDGGYGGGGGYGFGGGWGVWIVIFFLFALMGGGWGNGLGGNGGGMAGYSQVNDFSTLERENDIIRSDICNNFANTNQILSNGFQNIQTSFANAELSRANTQAALMSQMYAQSMANLQANCDTNAAITGGFANTNYIQAQQGCDTRNTIQTTTRDIIDSQRDGTNAILAALNAQNIQAKDERIAELTRVNTALQLAQSQSAQNAYLLAQLRPYPVPSWQVVAPGTTPDAGAAAKVAATA